MRITFYGVRGSCPAPGPTTVRHGGNTSCVSCELDDGTLLILDAGTGLRQLGKELIARGRVDNLHLLLSHTHWDHILGLPFFAPLYLPEGRVCVHPLPTRAQERFRRQPTLFDPIHFPIPAADVPARIEISTHDRPIWHIGGAVVHTVPLNHPGGSQGFRIEADGGVLCYLTDNELAPPGDVLTSPAALAAFARGCDVMIHDTQYCHHEMPAKHGWGHSTLEDVLDLARAAQPKHLILYHHDPDRSDDALDDILSDAKAALADLDMQVSIATEGVTLQVN